MIYLLVSLFEYPIISWLKDPFFLGCAALFLSSWLAVKIFPVIIYLCEYKNLMDEPGERKVHEYRIPNLGGVGMFVAFTVSITALGCFAGLTETGMSKLLALLSGVTILFFLGIKDDIIGLSPNKKFIGQVIAGLVVILLTDLRITSLGGLLGIDMLPYLYSVGFTLFVFLLVVNAFNLVDGIDGLAGSIAVTTSTCFGAFFLLNGDLLNLLASFIMIGAALGFLKYNVSEQEKLFMGDSGTLFIGFILAWLAIGFLEQNNVESAGYIVPNAPILVLAALSFPLLDTLRVFTLRILAGRSPFSADKNHIHHRLLAIGLSHRQTSFLIVLMNTFTIITALFIDELEINLQLLLIITVVPLLYLIPFMVYWANELEVPFGQLLPQLSGASGDNKEAITEKPKKTVPVVDPRVIALGPYNKAPYKNIETRSSIQGKEEEHSRIRKNFKKRLVTFGKQSTSN